MTDTKPTCQTPWESRADFEKDDHYADFTAWESWMDERLNDTCWQAAWESIMTIDRVGIYSAMQDACEFAANSVQGAKDAD